MAISSNKSTEVKPLTVLAIKLIAVAMLVVVLWPVPAMVTHTSPENTVVFGRYTLKYFLLMAGYLSGVAVWVGVTVWLVWEPGASGLARIRRYVGEHLGATLLIFALLTLAWLGVRCAIIAHLLSFPAGVNETMKVIPSLSYFMLLALLLLAIDKELLEQIEARLTRIGRGPEAWLHARPRLERLLLRQQLWVFLGFVLLAALLPALVLRRGLWDYPLGVDASVHVYIGQHVLDGGIPYQTFIAEYPPMRYVLSILWNLGGRVTDLSVVHFARALNIGVSVGILAVSYAMGRELTGRAVGGLLAAAILLGTEHLQELLIYGPTFRLTTTLVMMIGLWLAQKGRWFWAGVVSCVAALLYTPVVIVVGALILSAWIQNEKPRWRAARDALAGVLLVFAVTVVVLFALGYLEDTYRQMVLPVLLYLKEQLFGAQVGGGTSSFLSNLPRKLSWLIIVFKWNFRGDWELIALVVLGIPATLVVRGAKALRSSRYLSLLLAAILMIISILLDEGGMSDSMVRIVILAPFGAVTLVYLANVLEKHAAASLKHLKACLGGMALGTILLLGLADSAKHQQFLYSLVQIPLSEQQRMVDGVEAALQPNDTVLCLDLVWYLTLSGRNNALPLRELGYKLKVLEATGWTPERVLQELEGHPPVLIIGNPPRSGIVSDWVRENYVYMGDIDADTRGFAQSIFVLNGRDDIEAVVATWPLMQKKP